MVTKVKTKILTPPKTPPNAPTPDQTPSLMITRWHRLLLLHVAMVTLPLTLDILLLEFLLENHGDVEIFRFQEIDFFLEENFRGFHGGFFAGKEAGDDEGEEEEERDQQRGDQVGRQVGGGAAKRGKKIF